MTNPPCPRCGMLLGLDEAVCPHCRTPRGDGGLDEGPALSLEDELRAKRRPKLIAAGLAAGLLLAGAWLARGRIAAALADFSAEVERTRNPGHWKKAAVPEPLPAESPKPGVAVSSFVYLNTNAAAPPEASAPPPDSPSPPSAFVETPVSAAAPLMEMLPPSAPDEVRIHGTVYDLATKAPLPMVKVRFVHKQNGVMWEAATDSTGHYQLDVHKAATEAVAVMIEASGYRKGLLEDRDPSYRERTAQARAEVIAETTDSDLEPVPLRYRASAQVVQLDLALVPLERK